MAYFQKWEQNLFIKIGNWSVFFFLGTFCPLGVLSLGTFCLLGRFVPWDTLSLGHFVLGTFYLLERFVLNWDLMSEDVLSWDVLSLRTFCLLGRFVPWDVLSWDILSVTNETWTKPLYCKHFRSVKGFRKIRQTKIYRFFTNNVVKKCVILRIQGKVAKMLYNIKVVDSERLPNPDSRESNMTRRCPGQCQVRILKPVTGSAESISAVLSALRQSISALSLAEAHLNRDLSLCYSNL